MELPNIKLLLYILLWSACGIAIKISNSNVLTEVQKLRSELNAALEAREAAEPEGVIVQPEWTNHDNKAKIGPPSKVVANESNLKETEALRAEIHQAVAKQGQTEEVKQLVIALNAKASSSGKQGVVGSAHEELLGSINGAVNGVNVVDAPPLDIDLAQLHQLELSKRRTRELLVLNRIDEDLQFTFGEDVSRWLQLHQNGSIYFIGQRSTDLLLLQQPANANKANIHSFEALQTLPVSNIDAMLTFERWNYKAQLQESLLLLATEQQLLWYRMEPRVGLKQFWHWPLGTHVGKLLAFPVETREYLAIRHNHTLSIYAYDLEALEFWIVQRLQLEQEITAFAVLDTGRDLLLAVGQTDEALIYAHNVRELAPDAGLQLQLRQRFDAPNILDIASFQMGGRSYLALGGQQPQILLYVQGQLIPKTVLGQNFGTVELFLPVPVRSYRDDMLLLVQHRVYFEPHTLLQLEVLTWNGEAFEANLPAPCQLGARTHYGASCMLDYQRDAGLIGATLLRQVQPPMLLVPRQSAPSGLFRLHTELLPRNSELHDLQEIQSFLLKWINDQDNLVHLAEQFIRSTESGQGQYEEIQTPVLINEGAHLQALQINDVPWTPEDASTNLDELLKQIRLINHQLLDAHNTHDRTKRQSAGLFSFDYERLDFDVVNVMELIIEQLNHVPFYIKNATMQFNGLINMKHLELLQPKVSESIESLPSIALPRLQLTGDLKFEFINGLSWIQFVKQLAWRQQPLQLSQLTVHGSVIFEDSLHLSALNELSFPEDYLWSQGNSVSIVNGPKTFTRTLTVNALDTNSINGHDPVNAITLSDAQDWPGWVTFTQLEVSEHLDLTGSARGRQFEDAPMNPTLLDSRRILAACYFEQLIVQGVLQLGGLLDSNSYDTLLGDLAQRAKGANDELVIPGAKHVQLLILPVDTQVLDGSISGTSIERFVTKHSEQTLHNLHSLSGFVYFHQLRLSGAFDGVYLDQLQSQALRVDGPLLVPSTTQLRFLQDLQLTELHVTRHLNDVALPSGYQTLHESMHLSVARFKQLNAERLDVTHNVTGEGLLNGRQLTELLLKASQPEIVQVQDLILPTGVQATALQGLKADLLLGFLQQLDELPLLILHGQLQVLLMAVSGAVQVNAMLNGRDMAQLQREVVWLDRPNELRTRWLFQEPPIFASDLILQGSYNDRLLPELLDDIVFRSNQSQEVRIVGPKSFAGNVRVLNMLRLEALNGIPFRSLANRLQPLDFNGELHLDGQLHVKNLQLKGKLNDRDIGQLEKHLFWHSELGAFVQRGLIELPQMQLSELTVLGHLGNRSLEPLQEFFDDLLDKRQSQLRVVGHIIFSGRVSIRNGAYITQLNDINLDELLEQLIYINDSHEPNAITIHSPVQFEAPVEMKLLIVGKLVFQGERLNGCNVSDWIHDTVRVDRDWQAEESPISFMPGALDNNLLQVAQLNNLNLSRVVTLHTSQKLGYPLLVKELYLNGGFIDVRGQVNDRNLSEEYANTLLTNAPYVQRVETPLVMQTLHVDGSLLAKASINGDSNHNLSDVATLHEGQLRLVTPLHFDRLHAPELRTKMPVNGFNYSAWHEQSLWARGRGIQVISGNWRVRWLRVKNTELPPLAAHDVRRRQVNEMAFHYQELCQRFTKFLDALRLPYQVRYLFRSFALEQATDQEDLRRAFALQSAQGSYLLLNEMGCWTRIYRWDGKHFAKTGGFESGPIDDVVVIISSNSTNGQFSFMTSYELSDEQQPANWNCSGLANLQSWRVGSAQINIEPMNVPAQQLKQLQQQFVPQQKQRRMPSYQHAIKYLNRPSIESLLRPHLDATHPIDRQQFEALRERLLHHLIFRLQTEVNITQLSIPESDLYDDEQLVENFLELMGKLELHASRTGSQVFATLATDTLPLPSNPASVLAARSAQLIWPVLEQLMALHARRAFNNSEPQQEEQYEQLVLQLEHAVRDILHLANNGSYATNIHVDEDTTRLHAVIARLRQLEAELNLEDKLAESSNGHISRVEYPGQHWRPVQTIRLYVGAARRATLLYARLTMLATNEPPVAPSTAPAAHIQLHHANGTLFQSLAADRLARQLTALRVKDETLLAFVEGCCQIRVFIYRGIQGFVPFAQFEASSNVVQLLAVRLPLQQAPGARYTLAVVHARGIVFYELHVAGLFEPWLNCA